MKTYNSEEEVLNNIAKIPGGIIKIKLTKEQLRIIENGKVVAFDYLDYCVMISKLPKGESTNE